MYKAIFLLTLLGFSAAVLAAGAAPVQNNTQKLKNSPACRLSPQWCVDPAQRPLNYVKDELLLVYDSHLSSAGASNVMQKYHLQEKSSADLSSIKRSMIVVSTNGQSPKELMVTINQRQKDLDASTNNFFHTAAQITQEGNQAATRGNQSGYPLALTGIASAHQYTRGKGVKIGMIDTPIDILHRSLDNSRVRRYELVSAGNAKNQQHGTEVAGVLISQNPRIGIAPEASLLSVSAFSVDPDNPDKRTSTGSLVAKALDICIREQVDVLNLSFAGGQDPLVDQLINKAAAQGIIVVASAGNGGPKAAPAYPAAISNPNVVAVTAVDKGEHRFNLANTGSYIELSAPGVEILTTAPGGAFSFASGTSVATAHVTGVIALLLSMNKQGFSPSVLERTAIDLGSRGRDPEYGFGLVSVSRALGALSR